ncbi:HAD family hydrolase [Micromonospora sp. NPDC047557]|uniref:HAD family hydrolase n=1 Tax=Micromonospora sp. NPDC047557 TaxID=3364250 RepID=UPI0037127395
MNAALEQLCREARALLLDFDGPVCSIFAGYPAPMVAQKLVQLLMARGAEFARNLDGQSDPLEVLRRTAVEGDHGLTRTVEDRLIAAEVQAVRTAEPTPYGRETMVAARQLGLQIAVVSNNSAQAVERYLKSNRLSAHVARTVGRAYANPSRMKPNPAPILEAASSVGISPALCILVGDSLADIEGAKAAGVRVIGYANRPQKEELFRAAGADALVTSMRAVAEAFMYWERPG